MKKIKKQNKNIPSFTKKLFWDVNEEKLDTILHKKSIIERIINYGTLADWKWLSSVYDRNTIINISNTKDKFGRKNIRPSAEYLASLIFK